MPINIANALTLSRMLLSPFFCLCLYSQSWLLAVVIFAVAALTDSLDGFVARTLNQKTALGQLLDPLADKFLLVPSFLILSFGRLDLEYRIPAWLTLLVFSRDIVILLSVLLVILATGDRNFRPSVLGKLTTFTQFFGITCYLVFVWLSKRQVLLNVVFLDFLYYLIFAATLLSGLHYLVWLYSRKVRPRFKTPG